ncbi:MAG: DUF87 domain-containing protein [Candidatus Nezhaarchaeales archaeon]
MIRSFQLISSIVNYLDPYFVIFSISLLLALILYAKFQSKGKILLGRIFLLMPFYLDLREAKHVVIFGMTGSGKTNTSKLIVNSFKGSKLIIDWNGEYLIGRVARPSHLSISYLSMLDFCEALASSLQLTVPQYAMLLEVARDSSNLSEIIEKLRRYPTESDTRREIKNALLRRLEPLSYANLFSGSLTIDDVDTIDLSGLTFDAKRLVANVVLRLLYTNPIKQLLVLEEAQNLLIPRHPNQPPTSCELILDEIRKHGVRVLAVAQIPSLVSTTYRNAEYIILHRLSLTTEEAKDIGLTERERCRIAKLPNGKCLIINKGKKFTVTVFKARLLSQAREERENEVSTKGRETSYRGEPKNDGDVLSYLIEDLREINEWRRGITSNVDVLIKDVDELKQLTKNLIDKFSALSIREAINPNLIDNLKVEVDKMKAYFSKRMEDLECSLSYVKDRLLDLEEKMHEDLNLKGRSRNAR